jgi:hypothetical protein
MIRENGNYFCGIKPFWERVSRTLIIFERGAEYGLAFRSLIWRSPENGQKRPMFFTPLGYWAALFGAFPMTRDAALIVAARIPILANAALAPQQGLHPEILTMANEKLAAMLEGALGAQQESARLVLGMLDGESLPKLLRRAEAIGLAASRPARRRVRANAKRLAGGARAADLEKGGPALMGPKAGP